jgi:hypothetical protein
MKVHNDYWCYNYNDKALPDEEGNCSLCGARLVSAPLFKLGVVVVAPGALEATTADAIDTLLARHVHGDWGDVDEADKQENELSVKKGFRILSAYGKGKRKLWIITEADRSVTTILRPDEY